MAQQGESGSFDQISLTFVVFFLAIGITLLIWWLKRQWITVPVNYLRYYELKSLHYFILALSDVLHFVSFGHWNIVENPNIAKLAYAIKSATPNTESFREFSYINHQVSLWVRYPCIFIIVILMYLVHRFSGGSHFKQSYSMKSLRQCEVENWPQITPVLSLDLVKQDINKGPWAMAITPLDFGKQHQLIHKEQKGDHMVWGVDDKSVSRVLSMQLGKLWRGPASLPIHAKALMVIFLARATNNRSQAKKFIVQISASASSGKLNFAGVEEALKEYENSSILKWLSKRHAYQYTLLSTLLELARTGGVLASAEFLWLKPVDRKLWYILNSIGRQTAVVEISGVFAHWLAEKRMKHALKAPAVKTAVEAYRVALAEILYIDESDLWHFNEE